MKTKGYLIFHLNLAFSSIEEDSRLDVIDNCYHKLLDLVEQTRIPIGIELSGWTLEQIEILDSTWIKRFKSLIDDGKCELIGSGYCQIIGPLVPHTINEFNQRKGIEIYTRILGSRPNLALVNEMAFSTSMVDLYDQFDYEGMIMDRDNIRLSLDSSEVPSHARGVSDCELPILWSDSILFQKLQHFAHGDISKATYLNYLEQRIKKGDCLLPLYCNDAEVFDYRPGRFSEERPTNSEGEWNRIRKLLEFCASDANIEFISPSEALTIETNTEKISSRLASTSYPVPVKKQAKYNIGRWSVTGRNDLWLNTMCHRLEKKLVQSKIDDSDIWCELCELWSSDLRTHITEKKWIKARDKMSSLLKQYNLSDTFDLSNQPQSNLLTPVKINTKFEDFSISLSEDGIILQIQTSLIRLNLNLRRGLVIDNLAFLSHKMIPCIGSLPHGYFSNISLGADFYSGGVLFELPVQRTRFTDLEQVQHSFNINKEGNLEVFADIKTSLGVIHKTVEISKNQENLSFRYAFSGWEDFIGSLRLGVITLINEFCQEDVMIGLCNGGKREEIFEFSGEVNHLIPASSLVSSSRGLGATTGSIKVVHDKKSLLLSWDPSKSAVMPMLYRTVVEDKVLSRIIFSMKEADDTSKMASNIANFTLEVSGNQ